MSQQTPAVAAFKVMGRALFKKVGRAVIIDRSKSRDASAKVGRSGHTAAANDRK